MPILDFAQIQVFNPALGRAKLGLAILPGITFMGGNLLLAVTAVFTIPQFAVVISIGRQADSSNPSLCFNRVIGIAADQIVAGTSGHVIAAGVIANATWTWTPGEPIFLNGTGLSQVPPVSGFIQQIGTARANNIIYVALSDPILL